MLQNSLVELSLEGYIAFFAGIALIIGLVFWLLQREDRQKRQFFFEQFELSELRMSPYKIGLVYKVVRIEGSEITVVPIWDGQASIVGATELTVTADKLIPFDKGRFS